MSSLLLFCRCATKMHIPSEQFDHVPIYMLSPTPSPPNEKSSNDLFNWTTSKSAKDNKSTASATSDSETESKSLPPKISSSKSSSSGGRMSRIVKMLTVYSDHEQQHASELNDHDQSDDGHDSDHQNSYHHVGPLVKVCRDCKILVRHLIDIGRTNFSSSTNQT